MAETQSAIIYVGPPGQDSPTFGPLVAGRRYQTNATLAAYLVAQHPDFWRAEAPTKPAKE